MTINDVRAAAARAEANRLGATPPEAPVMARGRGRAFGVDATYTLAATGDGFAMLQDGPLAHAWGGQGDGGWQRDASGLVRVLEDVEWATSRLVSLALLGRWMKPDPGVTRLELVPSDPDRPDEVLVDLWPCAGAPVSRLALQPETWLPRSLTCRRAFGIETWHFSDYGDDRRPRQVEQELPGGVANALVLDARFAVDVAGAALCRCPTTLESGVSWNPDAPPDVDVTRTAFGFLLATVRLNGGAPVRVAFDTGAAVSVIDRAASKAHGLEQIGLGWINPTTGPTFAPRWRADRLEVGLLSLGAAWFTEMNLSQLSSVCGTEVIAVMGYDICARSVVDLEIGGPRLTLQDPARARFDVPVDWQPLSLYSNRPHVRAQFGTPTGPRDGLFRLDSGAPKVGAILNAPVVSRDQLAELPDMKTVTLPLPGGAVQAAIGPLPWIELRGIQVDRPRAVSVVGRGTAFDDEVIAGNLGQDVLTSARLIFDYSRRRWACLPV